MSNDSNLGQVDQLAHVDKLDKLEQLRGALTRRIAATGAAPTIDELAALIGATPAEVEQRLRALHDRHALLLHPHKCEPWVVHPFALAPGSCWVQTTVRDATVREVTMGEVTMSDASERLVAAAIGDGGYWANCLYCAFGIAAALRRDAVITTRLGGEAESVRYVITDGEPDRRDDVFHLSTPAARWWDNVIFACSSFQPFASEADIDSWCARHHLPRGAVLPIPKLWAFARDWYGGYVHDPWRLRTKDQAMAIMTRHGLTGPFWTL
jgi:hypothetical protein